MKIDINSDVGEGVGNENLLMPYISSCNIACGGHFGDEESVDKTIKLALKNKVKIGAHPSFPDKESFGRKLMQISSRELYKSLQQQISFFLERLSFNNAKLHHIKPHGALYNAITVDKNLAELFVDATQSFLKEVYLYVPYSSVIEKVAIAKNINIKYEAFADRNYNNNLTLTSRADENALITDKISVCEHVLRMVTKNKVLTTSGIEQNILADTFCIHGDTDNAIEIVKYLNQNLKKLGYTIG